MRNMSKQCEIVQDLLPLYVDGACSEASSEMIKEHLESCPTCNGIYQQMCSHTSEDILQKEKEGVIIRHTRKENQKVIKYLFFAIAVIYVPALFLVALFAEDRGFISTPYLFKLLVLFLYTLPFYLAFWEIGLTVCRILDKHERKIGERVFNDVALALAIAIVLMVFNIEKLLYPSLILAGVLILCWVISAIVYKKKPHFSAVLKQKTFWLCVLILMMCIGIVLIVSGVFLGLENVREVEVEYAVSVGAREFGSELDGISLDVGAEEQYAWNLDGATPSITVKLVNETERDVEYDLKCYVYKQTDSGWGLCSTDHIDFPDLRYTLPAASTVTQTHSISGYDVNVNTNGLYKFVVFIDEKAVWFTFEISVEYIGSNETQGAMYLNDDNVMMVHTLSQLDGSRDELKKRYADGDMILVFDVNVAYEVQAITRNSVSTTFSEDMQAVIFYQIDGVSGTYEITGNSSALHKEIEEAISIIRKRQAQ